MAKSLDIIDPQKELEPEEEQSRGEKKRGDFDEPQDEGGGVFYLVIGIIAVIVAAASALYILYRDKSTDTAATSPTAVVSSEVTESATASASATVSQTASAVLSSFKYTDEKIRIANGNGVNGEAARIKTLLEGAGFTIASTGNASKTYAQTTIFYKSGQDDLANALKEAIKDEYTATTEESDATVGTYDAVIALGSK